MVQSDVDRPVKADHFNNQSFEDRSTSNGFRGRNLYDDKRIKGLLLKDLTVGATVKNPNYRICDMCWHLTGRMFSFTSRSDEKLHYVEGT